MSQIMATRNEVKLTTQERRQRTFSENFKFKSKRTTRRVVGHHTSTRLTTEQTTIPALRMALKARAKEKQSINGLILHSDGGGQYYSKAF